MISPIIDGSIRLAALELITSELLARCTEADPEFAAKMLSDTQKAMALSPADSHDFAVFTLVAREFTTAIDRALSGHSGKPAAHPDLS
jgi:hypothetical protein